MAYYLVEIKNDCVDKNYQVIVRTEYKSGAITHKILIHECSGSEADEVYRKTVDDYSKLNLAFLSGYADVISIDVIIQKTTDHFGKTIFKRT